MLPQAAARAAAGLRKAGAQALLPRGHLFLRTFSRNQPAGPGPYRFSREELESYFVPLFAMMEFKEGEFGWPRRTAAAQRLPAAEDLVVIGLLIGIAWTVILPIFLVIGLGAFLGRILRLDPYGLNKLNLYVFVPALVFTKFLYADLNLGQIGMVCLFWICQAIAMWVCAAAACSALKVIRARRHIVAMGFMFPNSGNYGIPVAGTGLRGVGGGGAVGGAGGAEHRFFHDRDFPGRGRDGPVQGRDAGGAPASQSFTPSCWLSSCGPSPNWCRCRWTRRWAC